MARLRRIGVIGLAMVALAAVAIQLVPYGRNHANPPVRREPRWDSARTRALSRRACFDCHSNETTWPWYTSVAPMSWLAQRDVVEGRRTVNFSEWDRRQKEAHESAKTVLKGEMPPWFYTLPRPHARLTAVERADLVRGLAATFGRDDD